MSSAAQHRPQRQGLLLPPDREPGGLQGRRQADRDRSTPAIRARALRGLRRARLRRAAASTSSTGSSWPSPVDSYYEARRDARHRGHPGLHAPGRDLLLRGLRHRRGRPRRGRQPAGLDDEALYWQANTDKGEELLDRRAAHAGRGQRRPRPWPQPERRPREILQRLPAVPTFDLTGFDGDAHAGAFQLRPSGRSSPRACLGCGTCTFVCPTCQCYDIRGFRHRARRPALPLLGQLHVFRLHA